MSTARRASRILPENQKKTTSESSVLRGRVLVPGCTFSTQLGGRLEAAMQEQVFDDLALRDWAISPYLRTAALVEQRMTIVPVG